MNKKYIAITVALVSVLLSGCTERKIREFESMTPIGPDFNKFLADEYGKLATKDSRERYEQDSGMLFVNKAILAAQANAVLPEKVEDYEHLTDEERAAFVRERKRLLDAFDAGARDLEPEACAVAQTAFDYRIDKQSKGKEENELTEHHDAYVKAMEAVTGCVGQNQQPTGEGEAQATAPEQSDTPSTLFDTNKKFEHALFPLDSAQLTPQATQALDQLIIEIKRIETQLGRPITLTVVGHTDATGTENHNIDLSLRRAYAVRGYFHKQGITADRINIDGRGSSEPLVQTAKNKPEPRNRRVDVFMHN